MSAPSAAKDRPVVILGAGLTGMSAALELTRHGVDHWLIERDSRVGGLATTEVESGYRFDRTGHLLHLRESTRRERVLALLDEPPLVIARRSFVYSEGVYTRYPYQSNTYGLSPATVFECLRDFIRARIEPQPHSPANFEEHCRAHFGNAITERFMLPYNRRLWGVDPREITTSWCERFVPIPTLDDVLAGALDHRPRELGYNIEGLYPQHGIGDLTQAMGRKMSSLLLRSEPRSIDAQARRVDVDNWSCNYRVLISSLPLPSLLRLIVDVPEYVAAAAQQLRCAPLYYLDVALRRPVQNSMHWVYVPEDRFPFYRVGNYAEFSASMAPAGSACLYVELASRSAPDLQRLWPDVQAGLTEMGFIQSPNDVAFCRVRRIDHAYVIYDLHREPALATIGEYLKSVGIISTGRYGGWNYSSMEDAFEFGERAAETALGELV
jgi:protoporphyrinogen oxidase